jgi:hypothetical protein
VNEKQGQLWYDAIMSKRLQNLSKYSLPTVNESLVILFILAVGLIALNLPKPAKKHIVSEQQYYSQKTSVVINKPAVTTGKPPKVNVTPSNNPVPPIVGGLAPVISTIPTQEPVVFLGIDDGANKQQFELTMMQQNNIKASLFLANIFIKDNPQFFAQFQTEGSMIENHSLNHLIPFNHLSYSEQVSEICGQADLEQKEFGVRPTLFRPPGGSYNVDTQRAAATCGMKAVVLWIAKANGGAMQYQIGKGLRPGDIVLMHFRPEFQSDLQAFIDAQNAAGLHTELLENWLK